MKIAYVAKHGQNNNDDEGAITFALRKLGHTVSCISERDGIEVLAIPYDLVLFHKWKDIETISRIPCPTICWFFDEVHGRRVKFIYDRAISCTTVALTDGKFVVEAGKPNIIHMSQGADERVVPWRKGGNQYILYIGDKRGPRKEFIRDLEANFPIIVRGTNSNRVYKEHLAELISSASICVAPSTPVHKGYWSNRAYLLSSYGGVVAHADCDLVNHYAPNKEMLFYGSTEELYSLLHKYSKEPELQTEYAENLDEPSLACRSRCHDDPEK